MHFLITAGGTRQYLDSVRFISNASSGKMGYALAEAAFRAGHKVTLVSASCLQPPVGMDFVGVESAEDMFNAVKKFFDRCDCLIMAAAVADYTPVRTAKTKLKKSDKYLTIRLKPTKDILRWAGRNKKKNQILVGFALEDTALRTRAEKKLRDKNLDLIIANSTEAIGASESVAQLKTRDGKWIRLGKAPKQKIAEKILTFIEQLDG
jgi:phosphopantothenoylcysteine synthetase/decarboxylase